MTRNFCTSPVDAALVDRVLAAALRAPSAGFAQGVDLLVLDEPERRARFWELASDPGWRASGGRAAGLMAAPVLVLPVAEPDTYAARYGEADKAASGLAGLETERWPVPYWLVDAAFAVMLLLLAAEDAGLGSLFFRLHGDPDTVLAGLGVPPRRCLIGAVALGHPTVPDPRTSPSRRGRRTLDNVVHRERW